MSNSIRRPNSRRLLIIVIGAVLVAVLWFLGMNASQAVPRDIVTYTLTTASDFTAGTTNRTAIVNNIDGEVVLVPVGVTGVWVTDTQQLPAARMNESVVSSGNRIYVLGGFDNSGIAQLDVYSSTVVGNSLTPWVTQANALPVALAGEGAAVATAGGTTRIYVLGGEDSTFAISRQIYYAPLNPNGSVGAWVTNPISLPVELWFSSVVVNRNYIYVIGGETSTNAPRNQVYRAPINPGGDIGAWAPVSLLPQPNAQGAAVVYNGTVTDTIYVIGGAISTTLNSQYVYFADINPADGSLSAWITSTGSLPTAFQGHTALQAGGQIYVIGGTAGQVGSGTPRNTVLSALVDENNPTRRLVDFGSGQSWVETEPLPLTRLLHGSVLVNNQLFAVGGSPDGNTPDAYVYRGPIGGAGSRYAPSGTYLSPVTNVGGNFQLLDFSWSTVMTDTSALNVTVRYHTSTNGINWFPYSAMLPSSGAASTGLNDAKPITYPLSTVAQYFQYQVFFTTTNNSLTPFFTESHLRVLPPPPDLTVSKSAQVPVALPGDLLTYTIAYTNLTASAAGGVILTETVPSNTIFVGAAAGWQPAGYRAYTDFIGGLSPHASGTTYFVVRVASPPAATLVSNIVFIGGDPNETNLNNNSGDANTFIGTRNGIDLIVNVDDGVPSVRPGQLLTYVVSYGNWGNVEPPNARLTETLPLHTTYAGGPEWTPLGGGLYVHDLGTLVSATTASLNFLARVDQNAVNQTIVTDTVTIGSPGTDVDPFNNTSMDVDTVTTGGPVYLPLIAR